MPKVPIVPKSQLEITLGDKPPAEGMHVAYIDPHTPGFHVKERIFLMYIHGKWYYPNSDQFFRGKIYGFVGPIPVLKIKD